MRRAGPCPLSGRYGEGESGKRSGWRTGPSSGKCREVLGDFDEETPVLAEGHLMTAAASPQAAAGNDAFWLAGKATVRRLRRWKFRSLRTRTRRERAGPDGSDGWFKVYLGSGQRIDIPSRDRWTIRSIGIGGSFSPLIVDSSGRKVALAGMSHGATASTGRTTRVSSPRWTNQWSAAANTWSLRRFEDDLATITRYPLSIDTRHTPCILAPC